MFVQTCVIEVLGVITLATEEEVNGGLIAGFITVQGRENEQDTTGFMFNAMFGNALGASRAVGLGLAPKEKIGD